MSENGWWFISNRFCMNSNSKSTFQLLSMICKYSFIYWFLMQKIYASWQCPRWGVAKTDRCCTYWCVEYRLPAIGADPVRNLFSNVLQILQHLIVFNDAGIRFDISNMSRTNSTPIVLNERFIYAAHKMITTGYTAWVDTDI